ncbi:hypothetical protein [Runella rosea]|uniref:hypothetical protein n=1 Tax=Runella rosea TaxID=2259595 RepID=UPI0013B4535F|nr:hypothetical protein [Runella rosea]
MKREIETEAFSCKSAIMPVLMVIDSQRLKKGKHKSNLRAKKIEASPQKAPPKPTSAGLLSRYYLWVSASLLV